MMDFQNNNRTIEDDANLDDALDIIGIQVKRADNIEEELNNSDLKIGINNKEKPLSIQDFMLRESDRELAVKRKLVPENYKDARFTEDQIKRNLILQHKKSNGLYTIHAFDKYMSICNEILSSIRLKRVPRRSWLIGAPNGFGKSSFVNECLITMLKHGWVTVPYTSLHELAEIRVAEEQRLMRPFSDRLTQGIYSEENGRFFSEKEYYIYKNGKEPVDIIKRPKVISNNYSWSEYLNAKCLFVHFTSVVSKDLESNVLFQLLNIRGAKGLPTIVMISTSLQPYVKDVMLRETIWDEILDYNESANTYDRVAHVSTYKRKNLETGFNKDKHIDEATGIVS